MFKWINPINWFKGALAKAADDAIDENITVDKGKEILIVGINNAVTIAEKKMDDGECRTLARGLHLAGSALTDLGDAIDPDGEEGCHLSVGEFNMLLGDAQCALDILATEAWVNKVRENLKRFVRTKLNV